MKRDRTHRHLPLTFAALSLVFGANAPAGDLNPPSGSPMSTMKTLQQVEPRIPIHAADLPLTISQTGSYYLAENVPFTSGGITIATGDVTLDLRGHLLAFGSGDGIHLATGSALARVRVENGSLLGWTGSGVNLVGCSGCEVRGIRSSLNQGSGIRIGYDARVSDSYVSLNSLGGIYADLNGRVSGCIAVSNQGRGIDIAGSGLVEDSIAMSNTTDGIVASSGSMVNRCLARENTQRGIAVSSNSSVTGCTVSGNGGDGIAVSQSLVKDCTSNNNTGNGVSADGQSMIVGNACIANGLGQRKAGILVTGIRTRVDGNHLTDNDYGITVSGSQNLIIRNSAATNAFTNYDIVPGNDVGAISTAATATSPWANIQF